MDQIDLNNVHEETKLSSFSCTAAKKIKSSPACNDFSIAFAYVVAALAARPEVADLVTHTPSRM